jgi:hypothetical protein
MIDLFEYRRELPFHVGKIHDPAERRIRLAAHVHLDAERMAMQARTLVAWRDIRQPVRGFDMKDLEYVHVESCDGSRVAT